MVFHGSRKLWEGKASVRKMMGFLSHLFLLNCFISGTESPMLFYRFRQREGLNLGSRENFLNKHLNYLGE